MAFMSDAVEKARKAVGGSSALARLLTEFGEPITSQAISQWKRVPADRAHDVARLTGVAVHELRPDLWPSLENSTTTRVVE